MNKSSFKKFLTVLIVLMLSMSIFMITACNPDIDNPPADDKPKPDEVKPSFTNGNFANLSDEKATVFPKVPANWSGSGVTTSQSTPSSGKPALPASNSNTVSGIVSLTQKDYDTYKNKWGNLPLFPKSTTTVEGYTNDDNVLMIYNKDPAYYSYTSGSFSIAKNTDYVLTIDVKTDFIQGNSNVDEGFEAKPGAYIYLYGSSSTHSEFVSINTNSEWTTYSFYIKGTPASSKSVYLKLGLGKGSSTTTYNDPYLTGGYAFFDNVTFTAIDNKSETTYETAVESETVKKATTLVPNGEFNFVSGNNPAMYTKKGISNITKYTQVNTSENYFDLNKESYGNVENPGVPIDSVGPNIYMLYNKSATAVGMSTTNKLHFSRGRAFKVSMFVNTHNVTDGLGASLIMSMGESGTVDDIIIKNIDTQGEWVEYSFFICSNQNVASEFYFQFWLGTGTTSDTDTHVEGWAFFDNLTITELDLKGTTFDDAVSAIKQSHDADPVDLTTSEEDNLIKNGYFSEGLNGWTPKHDDDAENKLNGVSFSNVSSAIVNAGEDKITLGGKEFDNPNTPYGVITDRVMAVYAPNSTLYSLAYDYNALTIQPYAAYRFSMWVKTVDVPSSTGIYLTLKNEDLTLASFAKVNTENATDDINGYKELVCYFYGNDITNDVTIELGFGSGNKWTSDTLFSGSAYIANVSLVKSTYSEFNSASSSSTFSKKHNFVTAKSPSFTNGGFDNYNFSTIEGLTTGGLIDSDDELTKVLSKNFGTVSGWNVTSSSLENSYYGIVDTTRNGENVVGDDLVTNLSNTGLVGKADLENLFFKNPTENLDLFSYCGENKALFIGSPDNDTINKNFVSLGYTTSSTTTLSADSYYEISVLVKTIGNSKASIYLITDNDNDADASFTNINTATATDTNGWKKHTFRIKVGVSDVTVQIGLYLGESDSPSDIEEEEGSAIGGAVFFDSVTQVKSTEKIFNSEAVSTSIEKTKSITFAVDSFGTDSDRKHDEEGNYLTPSNWTGKSNSADNDTTNTNAGILITNQYNFVGMENEEELRANLTAHSGTNLLVINNEIASAYSFTSSLKTLNKDTYYRISVWAKTYGVDEGNNAYIKLNIPNKFNVDNQNEFLVNTGEYTRYDYYISTTENNSLSRVTLELGLGVLTGEEPEYVAGFALFDDVEWAIISEDEFETAKEGDTVKIFEDVEDITVDPEETEKEDDTPLRSGGFNWLLFSSLAFGAVLVVVVVVYFIKKYKPKKKVVVQKTIKKAKDDKYKNLND